MASTLAHPACVQRPLALASGIAGLQAGVLQLAGVEPFGLSAAAQRAALRAATYQAIVRSLTAHYPVGGAQLQLQSRVAQAPVLMGGTDVPPALRAQLQGIHIAVSYAYPVAVWAWHAHGVVGVDVEAVRCDTDVAEWQAVAQLYLAADAAVPLQTMQGQAFFAAFAAQWTLLEAQLKCTGRALTEAEHRGAGWNDGLQTAALALPADLAHLRASIAWSVARP